jgi:hypothetical protein
MQSTSDSGRPTPVPNPASGTEHQILPRGKLVVEVYQPEQLVPRTPRSAQKKRGHRPRGTAQVWAAVAVIGLHATFGVWLWTSTNALLHRSPLESLVMLDPIAPPEAHSDPAMPLPSPDSLPAPPVPPLPKLFQSADGSSEIAVSITASTDVLISNANAGEVEEILEACRADGIRPVPQFDGRVTLLVRVEKVGRVSDSRIEVGSGVQRLDETAQRCLLAHGFLSPRRVNGEPVASWQRVRWPAVQNRSPLVVAMPGSRP